MWTLQDAKNSFSAVVEAALDGRPQQVTRRGKPAVTVVSTRHYEAMLKLARKNRGSFVDHLLSYPGGEIERVDIIMRDVEF